MPTIRELYFKSLSVCGKNKNLSLFHLKRLLMKCNNLNDEFELTKHFDDEMKNEDEYLDFLKQATSGKMIEYIIHEADFNCNHFYVDENVLIPRQETEGLLKYFLEYIDTLNFNKKDLVIADVCTGSGCLGVSIAKAIPTAKVYASDISQKAINAAKINNSNFNTKVTFLSGNMLDPFVIKKVKLDCLICNPPYIENESTIDKRTWEQEPHLALLAKPSTKFYEEVFKNASQVMNEKFLMAFEIGEDMRHSFASLLKKYFSDCHHLFLTDMYGKYRYLLIYKEKTYKSARDALLDHGVIAFPTETVMGLGIVYDDEMAFNKLNKIKQRPENKPYSLMLGDVNDIKKYAHVTENEEKVIKAFLPGPLTILLKKKKMPKWVTLNSNFVGIRVPNITKLRKIISDTGKPILAPSANISGQPPALTHKEVKKVFKDKLDYIVGGDALNSAPSTIVRIGKSVKIIRQGPITKEQILEVLKDEQDCDRE